MNGHEADRHDADAALVARAQQGDTQAFDLLVLKYQRRIMRLLSRMVADAAEVEDVAQEAFINAWRSLPQFRGESVFYSWLYRIAINCARNWQGASMRRRAVSQPDCVSVAGGAMDGAPGTLRYSDSLTDIGTPDAQLASRQMVQAVQTALQALPEELRTALLLRETEGLSYAQIGDVMQCPPGTVRSRIFRARQAISEQLRTLSGD